MRYVATERDYGRYVNIPATARDDDRSTPRNNRTTSSKHFRRNEGVPSNVTRTVIIYMSCLVKLGRNGAAHLMIEN